MNLEKLKSFFTQLFTDLNTEDSLYVLLFLTISFLIGLLFGAMSRGRKIRRLSTMVKERDDELITLRAENGSLKERLEISEEQLQKAQLDYETTNSLLGETEVNRNRLQAELEEVKLIVNRVGSQDDDSAERIDELNEKILDLQLQNDKLSAQLESANQTIAATDTATTTSTSTIQTVVSDEGALDRFTQLEKKMEDLASENISLRSELIDIKGQSGIISDNSISAIKARLEQVELENDRLQKDLSNIKDGSNNDTATDISPEDRQAQARTALNNALGTRIKRVAKSDKNNLKLIDGIGPFIENKLNDIGIYTFEQIAQLDEELIDHITDAIQFFPGRIQRDDWVGQAKKLMT